MIRNIFLFIPSYFCDKLPAIFGFLTLHVSLLQSLTLKSSIVLSSEKIFVSNKSAIEQFGRKILQTFKIIINFIFKRFVDEVRTFPKCITVPYNFRAYSVWSLTLCCFFAGIRIFAHLDQRPHYDILLILLDAAFFLDGHFPLEMVYLHSL